jgi:hypothetical protein
MNDRQRLAAILAVVCKYLPPDGISKADAMNEIISLVDPLPKLAKPGPVEHAVIAGVLFDCMGWLTSRQERLVLSSCDDASPAVKVIEEFAKMRGLSLDDAKVKDWQDMTAPPRKTWQGLTEHEIWECQKPGLSDDVYKLIEAKLRERNT